MIAIKAGYALIAAGLTFATPAAAEFGGNGKRATEATFRFRADGPDSSPYSVWSQRLRQSDRGNGYGHDKPRRPGKPGKPGNGHGHGHHPCRGDDRCHASPG